MIFNQLLQKGISLGNERAEPRRWLTQIKVNEAEGRACATKCTLQRVNWFNKSFSKKGSGKTEDYLSPDVCGSEVAYSPLQPFYMRWSL